MRSTTLLHLSLLLRLLIYYNSYQSNHHTTPIRPHQTTPPLSCPCSTEVTLTDMGRKTVGNDLDNASIQFRNMRYCAECVLCVCPVSYQCMYQLTSCPSDCLSLYVVLTRSTLMLYSILLFYFTPLHSTYYILFLSILLFSTTFHSPLSYCDLTGFLRAHC
jgi:hypothetical protein